METIDKLKQENSALKYEISMLTKQIDRLNDKSIDIRKQNVTLTEKFVAIEKNNIELEKVQQEKNSLFASIINDIKNPTVIIKSLVELLSSFGSLTSAQQEIVQNLVETTKQVISLSDEISKVLDLESSNMYLIYEVASVQNIVDNAVRKIHTNAEKKQQEITVYYQKELPKLEIDVEKVIEALDYVISNAIKHTQYGGKIEIRATKNEENIEISVTDNGLGMSNEDLDNIFNRRANSNVLPAETDNDISISVNLWIAKKIIDAHKGKVQVKSRLGRGTQFVVKLPISAQNSSV